MSAIVAARLLVTVVVEVYFYLLTSSSAVAKRPRDASCLSEVGFNSTKRGVECFYHAMRCKRGLCCHAVSVRPSVCSSVTFVDHVKTNKHMFEFFSPSGSHTILVYKCYTDTKHRAASLRQQTFLYF